MKSISLIPLEKPLDARINNFEDLEGDILMFSVKEALNE